MILQHPRWTDQPEFEEFNGLLDLAIDGPFMVQIAEVTYKGRKGVAVSAGNLFASQTILVPDCREALQALNVLREASFTLDRVKPEQRAQYKISVSRHGWEMLPNKEKENAKETQEG